MQVGRQCPPPLGEATGSVQPRSKLKQEASHARYQVVSPTQPPTHPPDGVPHIGPHLHQLAHGHPGIGGLLPAVVADGGDDVGRRTHLKNKGKKKKGGTGKGKRVRELGRQGGGGRQAGMGCWVTGGAVKWLPVTASLRPSLSSKQQAAGSKHQAPRPVAAPQQQEAAAAPHSPCRPSWRRRGLVAPLAGQSRGPARSRPAGTARRTPCCSRGVGEGGSGWVGCMGEAELVSNTVRVQALHTRRAPPAITHHPRQAAFCRQPSPDRPLQLLEAAGRHHPPSASCHPTQTRPHNHTSRQAKHFADSPHRTVPSSSSKLPGTTAPAAASAAFLACADSASPPLLAPACPNCTSDLNSLAQVPLQGR